ncbi:hypothetical protein EST38_g11349 [Candolleomyces aberdarensis]|uniref:F-box domain-containing protein n=1 Tax=Candolleomyces aberdarensis TaxID=2316362 RepID=A0A4Q2D525_9AGAR|nr:hypothetical protein EST38_g11349 [Candolleomyces aberdarensis]
MTRSSARLQQKEEKASKTASSSSKKSTKAKVTNTQKKQKVSDDVASKSTTTKAKATNTRKKAKVSDDVPSKNAKASASKPNPAWAKVKGKRGQLKMVVEMPFDILLEIFKYLLPADLLGLAMANKALRGLLLDRTVALPLWKKAFESVQPAPPACPEELILPQTSWVCYLRFCKGCLDKEFIKAGYAMDTRDIRSIIPSYYEKIDGSRYLIVAKAERRSNLNPTKVYTYMHPRADYERNSKELARLADSPVQRKAFIDEGMQKMAKRNQTAWNFRGWEWQMSKAKKDDVQARRNNRVEALTTRLTDLGYGNDLARLPRHGLATLPGFKGVKPLTEREWEKLMPDLVDIFEELRKEFEKKDRANCLYKRSGFVWGVHQYFISNHRDLEPTGPTPRELAMMEPFRTLVYDAPREQHFTQADMLAHLDKLPEVFKSWAENTANVLLNLLPQEHEGGKNAARRGKAKSKANDKAPALDAAALDLATTLFSCKWCPEILVYPNVLTHHCLISRHKKENKEPESEEESGDPNCAWNKGHDQVEFDEVSSACASTVVTALGKDPKTTTWKELDEADQRVECLSCRKETGKLKRIAMDWRHAVLHAHDVHSEEEGFESNQTRWQILDSESLILAYDKEGTNWRKVNSWNTKHTILTLCVQCDRLTIENNRVEYPRSGSSLEKGSTTCPRGHDLTQEGAIYRRYPREFSATQKPVRIT